MGMARPVSALLTQAIDAHRGMARWNECEKVEATIVSGGGFFPLKGVIQDPEPRRMTVWLHEERSSRISECTTGNPANCSSPTRSVHERPDSPEDNHG
jgi:hypothetical protein